MKAIIYLFYSLKPFHRLLVAVMVLSGVILTPMQRSASAAGTECSSSSPVSAAYMVTVCIAMDSAMLSGNATVTATVTVAGTNPGIQKLTFDLGGQYLLTDYAFPYTSLIPTTKFVDGTRLLEVEAHMRDGFISSRGIINVVFNNGINEPPINTDTFTPATGTTPGPGKPFILAATGDGASGESNPIAVTDLVAGWNPNMFLYLGDGSFNIALTTTNATAFSLASRESGVNTPQLVIETTH